jgi:hypothetical protein
MPSVARGRRGRRRRDSRRARPPRAAPGSKHRPLRSVRSGTRRGARARRPSRSGRADRPGAGLRAPAPPAARSRRPATRPRSRRRARLAPRLSRLPGPPSVGGPKREDLRWSPRSAAEPAGTQAVGERVARTSKLAGGGPGSSRPGAAPPARKRFGGRLGEIGHGFVLKNAVKRGAAGSDPATPSALLPVNRNKCKARCATSGACFDSAVRDR